jgi:hypothetical protein
MARQRSLMLIAAVAALWALPPSRGDACENAVLATDESVASVKKAEEILNGGDPVEARRRIHEILGGADEFDERTPSAKGLTKRAKRIIALANVRLDDLRSEHREVLLDNAVLVLSRLAEDSPGDAAKKADLAEALARTNAGKAKKILEDLAKRDVVATPYAYAALARLRASDGDEKGRDEAMARCKQMAKPEKVRSICKLNQGARSRPGRPLQ